MCVLCSFQGASSRAPAQLLYSITACPYCQELFSSFPVLVSPRPRGPGRFRVPRLGTYSIPLPPSPLQGQYPVNSSLSFGVSQAFSDVRQISFGVFPNSAGKPFSRQTLANFKKIPRGNRTSSGNLPYLFFSGGYLVWRTASMPWAATFSLIPRPSAWATSLLRASL